MFGHFCFVCDTVAIDPLLLTLLVLSAICAMLNMSTSWLTERTN